MVENEGLIFDIQGHSVHDGPGTRTVVFMSGCNLRCKWCANPEGLLLHRRLMYRAQSCKMCPFRCIEVCPSGAVQRSSSGNPPVLFDREFCDKCDRIDCADVCYPQALKASGEWYSVERLMRILIRDSSYWGLRGGVTLSGGEPLLQSEFALELLSRCNWAGIDACIETNGYAPRSVLQSILPLISWLFIDIKHMDSAKHAEGTGLSNLPVLENIRWLSASSWPVRIVVRVPVVPDYNDSVENAEATANFLTDVSLREVNLLPFHRLGTSKYEQLGQVCEYADRAAATSATLEQLAGVFRSRGLACYVGSDTPF